MYPNKHLRELVPKGKCLATYYHAGNGYYMVTCWAPDYGNCGVHSIYFQEFEANIKALENAGYFPINMDELMFNVQTSTWIKRRIPEWLKA